jgi:competence protein ComEA
VARATNGGTKGPEYRAVPDILVPPTTWRERLISFGGRRRELWVLVVAVVIASGAGVVLWRAGTAPRIAPPATSPLGAAAPGPAPAATPSAAPEVVVVHVAGAVRRPGLYELPAASRVADAIRAAGGPRRAADLDALNLADVLSDGLKVDVPRRGETPAVAPAVTPGATPAPGSLVDLNQADQAALETIPGIGPVKAAAILDYRAQIGSFSSVDELLEVSGIGPATLETMRPYVTV